MRHLFLILLGLTLTSGIGYFVGYDHGFHRGHNTVIAPLPGVSMAAEAMASIIGKWEETLGQIVVEFFNDGSYELLVVDGPGNGEKISGHWLIFTQDIPDPTFLGPLNSDDVYIVLDEGENKKTYYKIVSVENGVMLLGDLNGVYTLELTRIQQ